MDTVDHTKLTARGRTGRPSPGLSLAASGPLRVILDAISDPVLVFDAETNALVEVNSRASHIFGHSREELLAVGVGTLSSGRLPYTEKATIARLAEPTSDDEAPFAWQFRAKDGRLLWGDVSSRRLTLGDRSLVATTIRGMRATDHRRTEELRLAASRLLASEIESAPEGVLVVETEPSRASFNHKFASMWGLPDAGHTDDPDAILVAAMGKLKDPESFRASITQFRSHPEIPLHQEIELSDGRVFEHHSGEIQRSPGEPAGRINFFRDVTPRRRAERELQLANTLRTTVMETSPDGILVVDDSGRITSYNQRFLDLWHIPPSLVETGIDEPVLATVMRNVRDPDAFVDRVRYLYDHPDERSEDEIATNDGRFIERHSAGLMTPSGQSLGRVWFFRDVTERRRSAMALRDERDFNAALLSSLPGLFVLIDRHGSIVRWNANLSELVGLPDEQLRGRDALELVAASDRDLARDKVRETFDRGMAEVELTVPTAAGAPRTVHVTGRAISSEGASYLLAVGSDTTDAREAERRLKASEERFRTIFGSVNDGIIVHDAETGAFIDVNPRLCEMFGYTREELLALDLERLSVGTAPYTASHAVPLLRRAASGETVVFDWWCKTKDQRPFWIEVALRRARFDGGDVLLSTARDITERRSTEEALTYRDRVLHAITVSAAELVAGSSLATAMPHALEIAARAMKVDRVLVLERPASRLDRPHVSLTHAWQAPGVLSADATSLGQHDLDGPELDAWMAPLVAGIPVLTYARTATGVVAQIMREMNNLSTLLVPILVAGEYWGHIGVDDCTTAREWTSVEIDALGALAEVIGALMMREQTQISLHKSEERFRAVSETALDAIIMTDVGGRIGYWNRAAERIFGYSADEAAGKAIQEWLAIRDLNGAAGADSANLLTPGRGDESGTTVELSARRKDGVEIPVEVAVSAMTVGADQYAVGILRDITQRKRTDAQIVRMARYDVLTGLANRRVFVEMVQHAITRARRKKAGFAVLYFDLDHFKDVNDTLGHPIGDLLLQGVAQRISSVVRETDTVSRFGGDEFALIGGDITEPTQAAALADKLLRVLHEPFRIEGNEIRVGTSVGVAIYGIDSPDAETLLSHADVALYRAKSEGRGTYRFFTEAMDVEVRTRVTLGAELRDAISAEQFFLVYQPQVDLDTHRIIGIEALVRWRHPRRGVVSPDFFIPVAERTGLIVPLGRWVLRAACSQMKQWVDDGVAPPLIAVNMSGQQFKTPHELEHDIAEILRDTGLAPQRVELELTETVLMETSRQHNDCLVRLRDQGLRIAIDDFGNGYSSLDYLRRFHVDRIKIAQNFIADIAAASGSGPIVRAALGLAHELDIEVVVEGLETRVQLDLLKAWGSRAAQGFYFSRPLAAKEATALLRLGEAVPGSDEGDSASQAERLLIAV